MNNRKQKNKRGRNPRQEKVQYIKKNPEKKKLEAYILHLAKDQQ